jgi:hypothetical protein
MKFFAKTALLWVAGSLFMPMAFAGNLTLVANPVAIAISSAKTLNGTAGDYVTISGSITNATNQPISDITTYLSLVDKQNKLPVDLEDWSAEKGLYIGTIEPGQSLPLNWKIHFVKAGAYALTVIAEIAGDEMPIASAITQFTVNPKINLNPGQVLPVALGMPLLIFALMSMAQVRRNAKVEA